MSTLLDMYRVAFTLTTFKPDYNTPTKQIEDWTHVNKICHHTLFSALPNYVFNVYCSYKKKKAIDIWDSLIFKYIVEDVVR